MRFISTFVSILALLAGVNCDQPLSPISSHLTFSLDATSSGVSPSLSLSSGWTVESDTTRQYCLQTTGSTGLDITAVLGPSYTILMWIKHANDAYEPTVLSTNVGTTNSWGTSNGYFHLSTNGLYSTTPPQYLAAGHTGVKSPDNRVGTGDGDAGNPAPPAYTTGVWHHVAASFNNATATQTLYQQGVVTRTLTYTSGEMDNWVGSDALYLGKNGDYHPFKGCFDQIRIYDTVLTADQVKAIFLQAVL